MKTTELRFTEEQGCETLITEFVASDNGETIMYVQLGMNAMNNAVLHIEKDDARMIVQFLKTTFGLIL